MSTSIAGVSGVSTAPAQAATTNRDAPVDRLRTFAVLVVLFIHAAQAYPSFVFYNPDDYMRSMVPVADSSRWPLLDLPFLFVYTFVMPLFFFISGLYVLPGLERRGAWGFFLSRLRRLGPPFVAFAVLLAPLAFWPAYLSAATVSGPPYWVRVFTLDGWPIGPGWFLWVLLAFDGLVALVYQYVPAVLERLRRKPSPTAFILVSVAAFAPVCLFVPPESWISGFGPFDVQPGKVLLYLAYFLMGMGFGGSGGLRAGAWPRWPILWLAGGVVSFVVFLASVAPWGEKPPFTVLAVSQIASALTCACLCLGVLGLFLRQTGPSGSVFRSLNANAFGIYVVHYTAALWFQYLLLPVAIAGAAKFAVVFTVTLAVSWELSRWLRRIPAVAQAL